MESTINSHHQQSAITIFPQMQSYIARNLSDYIVDFQFALCARRHRRRCIVVVNHSNRHQIGNQDPHTQINRMDNYTNSNHFFHQQPFHQIFQLLPSPAAAAAARRINLSIHYLSPGTINNFGSFSPGRRCAHRSRPFSIPHRSLRRLSPFIASTRLRVYLCRHPSRCAFRRSSIVNFQFITNTSHQQFGNWHHHFCRIVASINIFHRPASSLLLAADQHHQYRQQQQHRDPARS